MATRTKQPRTSGNPARRADELAEAALKRAPRCQCRHDDGKCRRVARYRVSALCQEEGCRCAVSVYLACAPCKESWLAHSRACVGCPDLRVTAL
jgi:hypothetical protein